MPQELPAPRLQVLIAREARRAVVFRRGPSKHVQMIVWDLATDGLQMGQWLRARVYLEKSGLSPDGKLLVYFAGRHHGQVPTFTAVSRPPYFTALLFWPNIGTYGGGGWFESNRHVVVSRASSDGVRNAPPPHFIVEDVRDISASRQAEAEARLNNGWELCQEGQREYLEGSRVREFKAPYFCHLPNPVEPSWRIERKWAGMNRPSGPSRTECFEIHCSDRRKVQCEKALSSYGVRKLEGVDFAEWDHDGSLLFGKDGGLYRERFIGAGAQRFEARRIADLTGQRFRAQPPPPEARTWPD